MLNQIKSLVRLSKDSFLEDYEMRKEAFIDLKCLKPGFVFMDDFEVERKLEEQGSGGTVYLVKARPLP